MPLHERVTHVLLVQLIAVPAQPPPPLQRSVCVHELPSSQLVPVPGKLTLHVAVPLQLRTAPQVVPSFVQESDVPAQPPAPLHLSLYVQALPSSQLVAGPG